MSFTVVIPARYASTRLPGKPLMDIGGRPMIRHVWDRATGSRASRVIVATDDERINDLCKTFGAEVVMTSPAHVSGTDRLSEVARSMGLDEQERVVNVQGDEPFIPPGLINQVADNLERYPGASVATLCERIDTVEAMLSPDIVKVVFNHQGMAHYFSRAPVPWARDAWNAGEKPATLPENIPCYRHIGLYGYRVGLLLRFVDWPVAPAESAESLEQLRVLYNGESVHVDVACEPLPGGVDTQADLERVRRFYTEKGFSRG